MKSNYTILFVFLGVSLIFFSSCNIVKHVNDDEHLLKKNSIKVNKKKNLDSDVSGYVVQSPNSKVLGIAASLGLYNLGNKDFLEPYEVWKDSFPKKHRFFSKTFSEKQSRGYRSFKSGINKWYFENGEAPVILDSTKTIQTVENMKAYFKSQGYFRATVGYTEILNDNKTATVEYNITSGKPYLIDSISSNIKSPILGEIYNKNIDETVLKKNERYKYPDFESEADRISKSFRNSGVYHFNRNSIDFDVDTTNNNHTAKVKLNIDDRVIQDGDQLYAAPYKLQKIANVNIYTDYSFSRRNEAYNVNDEYKDYSFHAHDKLKFNSKLLANSIFIHPDSLYRDEDRDLTRSHLRGLKNFKLVDINYEEVNDTLLNAIINLTPLKKYSFSTSAELSHSNIKQMGVSSRISLMSRNIFKGAEILSVSLQGSFFNSTDVAEQDRNIFFNAYEFGGDVSLEIPRILFPIKTTGIIPKYMAPKTEITLGTSFQKNIGLDKQLFTGIVGYNWKSNPKIRHRLEVINSQFIKNLNPESYFEIYTSEYNDLVDVADDISETTPIPPEYYDENNELIPLPFIDYVLDPANNFETTNPSEYQDTQNIDKRYDIITENVLVPSITYEFRYNTRESYSDRSFSYFRTRIASAGAILTSIAEDSDDGTYKELFGIPVAQYIKLDLEYKKFWGVSDRNTLAFRSFVGMAIPYGNSTEIPFNRSYFIGGANDLRAWRIYDLGPGATDNNLEYNVGTLKILTSLEYRFDIINSLKGAFFADAGNIWDITDSDLIEEEGKFTGIDSLADIALGTGFGLRYDFSFLVVRFDLGFKTYEPYLESGSKWFKNYNFNRSVFNFGINYPF